MMTGGGELAWKGGTFWHCLCGKRSRRAKAMRRHRCPLQDPS
jgi:hypothetical protein